MTIKRIGCCFSIKFMNYDQYEPIIEAILFTLGRAVSAEKIAAAVELDLKSTKQVIHQMMQRYQLENRGIQILKLENKYQLCTKREYYNYLIRIASQPKKHVLTDVLLETLSIVAYKQPVTKAEIERIRGVKSDHAINKLIEYDLIQEVGRLDAPGRPILLATTEEFLRCFGVSSINDLPMMDEEQMEEMKEEAEEEIAVTM